MNLIDITDMDNLSLDALFDNAAEVVEALEQVGPGPADFVDAWEAVASVTAPAVAKARVYRA